ncbi:MAG TPA: hypothetical protein VL463_06250 [Kofleriaceae bacterium]|jgi:hypothetical protein|nr:hypothetical protein [Kofleriaceae bacterium]
MANRGPRVYLEELRKAVFDSDGVTSRDLRRQAADGKDLPPELAPVIDKIRKHAYKVTPEDIEALKKAGRSEDEIFELTCAAAVGVSIHRCERALATLEGKGDKS